MKTHVKYLAISFLPIFFLSLTENLLSQPNQEGYFETINLPGSNFDGINPEDIIYADNKYFVWGLGAVLVIDPNNNFNVVNTITLSVSAQYDYRSELPINNNPPNAYMAYNGDNRLYVLSPDNEICVINTSGNGSLIPQKIAKPSFIPDFYFRRSIIKYDQLNDRLFWLIFWTDGTFSYSYIGCYSFENDQPIQLWAPTNKNYEVFDIAVNEEYNLLYLSCTNGEIKVCPSNTGSLDDSFKITTNGINGAFLYVNIDGGLHRMFCISDQNLIWIDGDNKFNSGLITVSDNNLTCLTYCPNNDKLFVSGDIKVLVFSGSNPQSAPPDEIFLNMLGNDESTYYLGHSDNVVYGCRSNEIIAINSDTYEVSSLISNANNYYYTAATDPLSGKVLFCNTQGGSLEIFNQDATHFTSILTGLTVTKSCYNPIDRKFYFYSDYVKDESRLAIINYSNYSYHVEDIINFEDNISSCIYNPNLISHHMLISSYSTTTQIIKLDAATNQEVGTLNLDNGYCENIFITPEPNNRIYCATGMNSLQNAAIEVFNALDYSKDIPFQELGNSGELIDYRMKFCYDNIHDFVFFILYKRNYDPSNPWGFLGKIDMNDEENPLTLVELDYSPEKIVYAECLNKIFIKNSGNRIITYFECDNLNIPLFIEWPEGTIIMDIEYGGCERNHLLILGSNGNLDCFPPLHYPLEMSEFVSSMKYNPIDKKVYVFSPYDINRDHESWMYIIDMNTLQIYEKKMPNNSIWRYEDYLTYNEMVIDASSGRLLCPNGSHSNISVTPENIVLQPRTWNWLSFPRLDRSIGDPTPEEVLDQDNFSLPYTKLEMDHLAVDEYIEAMTWVKWDIEPGWQHNFLNNVYSQKGYKLYLEEPAERMLALHGTVLDPLTSLSLYAEKHNWTGYFLPYPQNPFDAIPQEITDNLYSMVSQYWSCYNYALIQPPPPTKSTTNTPARWRCACNQLKMELKYGDMVILHSKEQQSFTWNQVGTDPHLINKDSPEHFGFKEKANYTSYFIELDTNDLPSEIGAFAGDSCIGATKVLSTDTTVLICAYDEGFEGEEITFQTFSNTKSIRPTIDDYMVLNTLTGIRVKRRIVVGESQPFYVISLKDKQEYQVGPSDAWLLCSPNPASREVSLSYFISEAANVTIKITGIIGDEWPIINRGYQDPGKYNLKINNLQLPAGCYLITLFFNNKSITEKMILLN